MGNADEGALGQHEKCNPEGPLQTGHWVVCLGGRSGSARRVYLEASLKSVCRQPLYHGQRAVSR